MRWPTNSSRGGEGFTLLETLVALSLLAVAMLLTLSLLFQEPRTLARLAAHTQAVRALEHTAEMIRSGRRVPLGRELFDLELLHLPEPEDMSAQDLEIWSELERESGSGLYHLTLAAYYRVGEQWYERYLDTFVWYPR